MGACVSGSIAQPPTVTRPGPPDGDVEASRTGHRRPLPLPASDARVPSSQQKRFTSTLPEMPGTEPVLVYCQKVQVLHPAGTSGRNVVLLGSAG